VAITTPVAPRTAAPRTGPTPAATASRLAVTSTPGTGPCGVADVGISTTTPEPRRHPRGEPFDVTVAVRNRARHGCVFAAPGGFRVMDAGEHAVFALRLECPAGGCPPLAPDQSSLYRIPWDQRANQGEGFGTQVPPGTYHAEAAFQGYPPSRSASFDIV
jgi:hypothetical protein